MKHQYDYDAQTCIGFLKTYNLDEHYKLNIEPNHTTLAGHDYEHDMLLCVVVILCLALDRSGSPSHRSCLQPFVFFSSSLYGFLGSVDANTGDTLLGMLSLSFSVCRRPAVCIRSVIGVFGNLFVCRLGHRPVPNGRQEGHAHDADRSEAAGSRAGRLEL